MICFSTWKYVAALLLPLLPRVLALCSPSSSAKSGVDVQGYQSHLKTKIVCSIAKGERRAQERSANSRPVCGQCARPDALCVCDFLPVPRLHTQAKILILQHPNERRKKNLSTVPLLKLALQNVKVVVGYTFEPESIPGLELIKDGRKPLLLYPSADAIALDKEVATEETSKDALGSGESAADLLRKDDNLLIVMDGTWTEAKRMVRDSPRLVECCQTVQFTSEASSIYDALRSEPKAHCLSTLEACARALLFLEPQSDHVQESLHRVLQAHVDAHLANANMAPRYVGAAKHALFDKKKRRREIELSLFAGKDDKRQYDHERRPAFVWQRLPDGAMLRSLQPSDAALVDSWWEYRSPKSLPLVQRRINLDRQQGGGGCLGVEIKGTLVASIVRYEGGALGMLHVEESFRRRGYGKALLKQATRILERRGEDRVAFIVDGNQASEALFSSAGWEREDPHIKRKTGKRRAKRKWIYKDKASGEESNVASRCLAQPSNK